MARWLVMLVLTCGCRQLWGLGGTPDLAIDASESMPDAPPDAPGDATLCFGSFGDAPYCLDALPTTPITFALPTNVNTQNSVMCLPGIVAECVIAATRIDIDAKISVIGNRPLVLISTSDLQVAATGEIDAASHRGGNHGAASNDKSCDNGHDPGNEGGGQGGSFGGGGGRGGNGVDAGGTPGNTAVPTTLRGGCP
ncbi:MAG TPA: hypothetical protein VGO00_23730, partial [Kofleriaceae bacterium]|nr:hypothetical protein [Kofleriaceae bacterium]